MSRTQSPQKDEAIISAAVELLHMATLVHDDVLDRAPMRRGRPTVFWTSGRDAATATGDFLFSRAFAQLAATGSAPAVRARHSPPVDFASFFSAVDASPEPSATTLTRAGVVRRSPSTVRTNVSSSSYGLAVTKTTAPGLR